MINYIKGDLFTHEAADTSKVIILAHACNCHGSWGAGVATIFKKKFPSTYKIHQMYCQEHTSQLLGSTQLIRSSSSDPGNSGLVSEAQVACLFTSNFAGTRKLAPPDIVHYTDLALQDLANKLREMDKSKFELFDSKIVINMPKINAGLFQVPWEDTEAILRKHDAEFHFNVYVL